MTRCTKETRPEEGRLMRCISGKPCDRCASRRRAVALARQQVLPLTQSGARADELQPAQGGLMAVK